MGCATDWDGMSQNDTLLVAASLEDMSKFHVNVDHMLQGFVNFQFLARLVNDAKGFAANPAFQQAGKLWLLDLPTEQLPVPGLLARRHHGWRRVGNLE